jgi:DNA-binding NtrC family response regulator
VVDDEADILDSLQTLLESALDNVKVTIAASGREALTAMDAQSFDLILTDYKMPGMNGLEFLAEARERAPTTPKIMLTAFPDLELAISALNDQKIEKFLVKPIEPDKLLTTVEEILSEQEDRAYAGREQARALDELRRKIGKR